MKLTFIGAAHEVTGSCHVLQACGKNILVDCGMEQGLNIYENEDLPFNYSDVDYVFLTHAHIDHSGYLPLIYARGFKGRVFATKATTDLSKIMLKDSAHIQEFEAAWRTRKAKRAGKPEVLPLYEMKDAEGVLEKFRPCEYDEKIKVSEGLNIRFTDAGHLLGSACVEVWMEEDSVRKKIVFSGDIGNTDKPIIRNPSSINGADYVVMESTYGDRLHAEKKDQIKQIAGIIQKTLDRGGNLVIPAFAVGRTQEMLYFIRKIKAENMVKGHDGFEVYVDSPLAIEATSVFTKNLLDCFDEETKELLEKGINPISFSGLKLSITSDESKQINMDSKSKIIISASGMCDAGRVRHHLKHNLWRSESTIMFAGYQANGTLGRSIVDGTPKVKLFGEEVNVKSDIEVVDGISSHADMHGLFNWIENFGKKPEEVFVVHGQDTVCDTFAQNLEDKFELKAWAPFSGSSYDLAKGNWITEKSGNYISPEKEKLRKATGSYLRLNNSVEKLLELIKRNNKLSKKEAEEIAKQIDIIAKRLEIEK